MTLRPPFRALAVRTASTLLLAPLVATGAARASFFQIAESCPGGLGQAFAGGAARAEDACTVWFNPAGMTRLEGHGLLVGLHAIEPSLSFDDSGSTLFFGAPLTGGEGGDAGEGALVPNVYYTRRLGDRWAFGLGLNAPFGLVTEYDSGWVGRYHALRSDLAAFNVNPALAFRVTPTVSLGLGIDYQRLDAELSQAVDFGTACAAAEASGTVRAGTCATLSLSPQADDGVAVVESDGAAWGYNAGALWEPLETFRIGLHYRSEVAADQEGDFRVTPPHAGAAAFAEAVGLVDTAARADVDLPDTVSASAFLQATPSWALMADASRTGWSSLPELRIRLASGAADQVTTLGLEDSWRYALGARYAPRGPWTVRLGAALDATPVPDPRRRSVRLPDEDRTWYTVGLGYEPSDAFGVSISYALIEVDDAVVDKVAAPGTEDLLRGSLRGTFDFSVDVVSVEARWSF